MHENISVLRKMAVSVGRKPRMGGHCTEQNVGEVLSGEMGRQQVKKNPKRRECSAQMGQDACVFGVKETHTHKRQGFCEKW